MVYLKKDGQANQYKILGDISFAVKLEGRHTSIKEAASARRGFFARASQSLDRFLKSHKIIDTPINTQVIDLPQLKKR